MRAATRIKLQREYFIFLLPIFFVFHGYIENLQAIRFSEALLLAGEYLLISLLIFGNAFLIFRSRQKAALFTFCLLFYHLFFGAMQDTLKKVFHDSLFSQYSFILPASFVCLILLIIFLRRTKRQFNRLALYLNFLFLLLIVIDIPRLIYASATKKPLATLRNTFACDTCQKPDIYLIIADEYADSSSLSQIFNYNNGAFLNQLRERGFHVMNKSRSNYNFTPFAMASLLQMNYLTGIEGYNSLLADKNRCYQLINESPLWGFLKQQGYEIHNHSIFNLNNIPTEAPQNYILIGADNIVAQTFFSRLNKDLRYHLSVTLKWQSEIERMSYFINRTNQLLLSRLLDEPGQASVKPKFVYTHVMMPHYPYYFRKNGDPNPIETLQEGQQVRKKEYLEYLQFANSIYLATIDSIRKSAPKPPVIFFMGDHGYREFDTGFEEHAPYYYMNLNTLYLPNADYGGFYEGISSVNDLRVLLNTVFKQKIPLLKDSSILLHE